MTPRGAVGARPHEPDPARAAASGACVEFAELFEPQRGVAVLVVTFLALLELARELLIEITQSAGFASDLRKIGACSNPPEAKRILEAALLASQEPRRR